MEKGISYFNGRILQLYFLITSSTKHLIEQSIVLVIPNNPQHLFIYSTTYNIMSKRSSSVDQGKKRNHFEIKVASKRQNKALQTDQRNFGEYVRSKLKVKQDTETEQAIQPNKQRLIQEHIKKQQLNKYISLYFVDN